MSKSTTSSKTVIVGGGVAGLSLACELARRGERSITLVERGDPGAGATFQSGGGIRRVFGNQLDVQIMLLSLEILERFAQDFGVDPRFQRIGYLYLLQTDEEIAAAEQALEVVRAEGVDADLLSAADVRERFPWIAPHGIRHALWSPHDGYASTRAVVAAMSSTARSLGVDVRDGVAVEALDVSGGTISRVCTPGGDIEADVVVLAAGAWSAEVAALAGVTVPIAPFRRQRFQTRGAPAHRAPYPFTFDLTGQVTIRDDGARVMGSFDRFEDTEPSYNTRINWRLPELGWETMVSRFPDLRDHPMVSAQAGVVEKTPDRHPLIGFHAERSNLFCLCGFSGHGFMQSFGAAVVAADLLTTGHTSRIPAHLLAPDRFTRGEPLPTHLFL